MKRKHKNKIGMKKLDTSLPFDKEEFIKKTKKYFEFIKPGLAEGKSLYADGILNMPLDDLQKLDEDVECIFFLTILIQAYPGETAEFEKDTEHEYCNALKMMLNLAVLQKLNFIKVEQIEISNKIKLDNPLKICLRDYIKSLGLDPDDPKSLDILNDQFKGFPI